MPVTKDNFVQAIQDALPEAKVFWEKAPSLIDTSCELTAVSLVNSNKKFTLKMPKGLGEEPLDDVVEEFVNRYNAQ